MFHDYSSYMGRAKRQDPFNGIIGARRGVAASDITDDILARDDEPVPALDYSCFSPDRDTAYRRVLFLKWWLEEEPQGEDAWDYELIYDCGLYAPKTDTGVPKTRNFNEDMSYFREHGILQAFLDGELVEGSDKVPLGSYFYKRNSIESWDEEQRNVFTKWLEDGEVPFPHQLKRLSTETD